MTRHLAQRLLPLALLLAVVVSVSAPLAFYALQVHERQSRAAALAAQVSDRLARESHHRPRLWRYDTLKLVEDLGSLRAQPEVVAVSVIDAAGRPVDLGAPLERLTAGDVVWGHGPILAGSETVGEVWAALSTKDVRRNALLLLVTFGAVGLALGGLLYWLPLRTVREAEALLAGYSELQQSDRHHRQLSTRALGLQEDERRAIARNLHDAAGQTLTAIRINLQLLRERVLPPDAQALVEQALALTDETVDEIRLALLSLAPPILDEVGLVQALERLCDAVAGPARIDVRRDLPALPLELPAAVEGACYRIAQEALTNVARHAQARVVTVRLATTADRVLLEVSDDGRGFDPAAATPGRGLSGIRERVEVLSGTASIESVPGRGTTVHVELPLAHREAP